MKAEILAGVLIDAGIQNVFVHHMPAEIIQGVQVKLPLEGTHIDHNLPGYYKGTFQIIIRAPNQIVGDALSKDVTALLTMKTKRTFASTDGAFQMQVNYILPDKLPIRYPSSDGNKIEWSLNFCASYVMT